MKPGWTRAFRLIPFLKCGRYRGIGMGIVFENTSLGSGVALLDGDLVRENIRILQVELTLLLWKVYVGLQLRTNPQRES